MREKGKQPVGPNCLPVVCYVFACFDGRRRGIVTARHYKKGKQSLPAFSNCSPQRVTIYSMALATDWTRAQTAALIYSPPLSA